MAASNEVTGLLGQGRASYANMLKLWYAQRWDDHMHQASMIMKMIGQRGESMGGERVKGVVVTGYPQSAGINVREGRPLPTARVGTQINPELFARDFYTLLMWTGQAERAAAAGAKAAWAKPRKLDMELARKQADINMCRKLYLAYGEILGVLNGNATLANPTVVTVQGRNARTSSGAAFWYNGTFYNRVNQSVGFVPVASGALGAPGYDIEGTAANPANETYIASIGGTQASPTFTLDRRIDNAAPNYSAQSTDFVVPFANRALAGYANAQDDITLFSGFNGIANIATDTSIYAGLYGLAKSTNPTLSGVYQAAAGVVRNYEERLLTILVDTIRDAGTGNEPDVAVCHSSTRREVVQEHDGDRRYAPVQTDSGFGKLVAHVGDSEIPYYSDWMCLPAMVIALNTDCWSWVEQSPMGPIDDSLERWVAGFDQHQIIWHKSGNIECQRPFDQGIIDDISINVFGLNV